MNESEKVSSPSAALPDKPKMIFGLATGEYSDYQQVLYLRGPDDDALLDTIYAEAYAAAPESKYSAAKKEPYDVIPVFAKIACDKYGFEEVDVRDIHFGSYGSAPQPPEWSKKR